jgi:hypothetical protein
MSRRRQPKKQLSSAPAPNDGTPLGHLSDAELVREFAKELARRRLAKGATDLNAMEAFAEDAQQEVGNETLQATLAALPPEEATPKPCPRCGRLVPVKARNRVRHVLTVAGEVRVCRNYHRCVSCELGFYPRDIELKLPDAGEVSDAMERRILDFGVNDTFEAAAERWSIHSRVVISPNLVRRVVERVGERANQAPSALAAQRACRPSPEEPAAALVVAADGSMLLTREAGWKEAKVAVVARAEDFLAHKGRATISEARYVATLGNQAEFKAALHGALEAERADEVGCVVWLGDGAPENWTLAKDLCPFAVQVLDFPHAVQNAIACAKALLGEADALLPSWELRIKQLLDAPSPDAAIAELMDCLPYVGTEEGLKALDSLVGYYRRNEKRMQYTTFRECGLPIGSGIVESAHRHVLQVRMKRAGQRWSIRNARNLVHLRALYRTAGARRFHASIRDALQRARTRFIHRPVPNAPRRAMPRRSLHRGSRLNRALLDASK